MSFNVDAFRRAMKFDGARPNLFEVTLPDIDGFDAGLRFFCKAAQIPGSTIGVVEVPYFGRQVKFAGNRVFPEWTVTIINDEDFKARKVFDKWHQKLNGNKSNERDGFRVNPLSYTSPADVIHYGKAGNEIARYQFTGLFPSDVTPIDLDWGNNDVMEEFTVTFAYQYWTVDRPRVKRSSQAPETNTRDNTNPPSAPGEFV